MDLYEDQIIDKELCDKLKKRTFVVSFDEKANKWECFTFEQLNVRACANTPYEAIRIMIESMQ
jgi:hypothetical protein